MICLKHIDWEEIREKSLIHDLARTFGKGLEQINHFSFNSRDKKLFVKLTQAVKKRTMMSRASSPANQQNCQGVIETCFI